MPQPYSNPLRSVLKFSTIATAVIVVATVQPGYSQVPADKNSSSQSSLPTPTKQPSSIKAAAYYHYSLGHLYEELAAGANNRSDYVNKAIDNFR